jgi:predicted ATP-grasp superfamily ATP-dependent carboligase
MKQQLITYLQRIGYRGLFGEEFKLDPRDGVFKLLEINARSLGGNYFTTQCGINDVFIAYRDAIGEEVAPATHYMLDRYKIKYLLDIPLMVRWLLRGKVGLKSLRPYFQKHAGHIHLRHDVLPFVQALRAALTLSMFTRYIRGTDGKI